MGSFEAKYQEFIDAVPIDKTDLDNEAIQQPELYRRIADLVDLAVAERDKAKRDLATVEANADLSIRDTALASKEKVTETEVKRLVTVNAAVTKATSTLADLTLEVSRLNSLKESIAMRKDMFKVLSQLYHDQYWSREASINTRDVRRERVREAIRSNRGKE